MKIHNFEQLCSLPPSTTHMIEPNYCDEDGIHSAWLCRLDKIEEDYLSSHTFYGGEQTQYYEELLNKCGFEVELVPYGGES